MEDVEIARAGGITDRGGGQPLANIKLSHGKQLVVGFFCAYTNKILIKSGFGICIECVFDQRTTRWRAPYTLQLFEGSRL